MFEASKQQPGRDQLPDKENRELMGVMRVGALAASTVLNGECEFMMVMMMKEKPTYQVLNNIAKKLDQRVPHEEHYNFGVKPNYQEGGIEIWRERQPEMMILIKMTSQRWGAQVEDDPMLTVAQKMELKMKEEAEQAATKAKQEATNGEMVKQEPEKVEEVKEEDEKAEVKQEQVEPVEPGDTTDEVASTEPPPPPTETTAEPTIQAESKDETMPKEEEQNEEDKVAAIEAEMETKTAPSTSTLKLATTKKEEEDDEEEGEIKMIDPTGDEKSGETEPESEKSEEVFERKVRNLIEYIY